MMHQSAAVQQRLDGFFRSWKLLRFKFLPCKLASALRGPYSFFFGEERIWKERRRAGRGVPRPTDPPPWVGVGGAGGYVSTTRQICECIRALYPVSRPLAASLLLTHCGGDLKAFFQGCTLFRLYEKDFRNGG